MSRNTRIALIVGALLVAVVGFVVLRPADDDDESEGSAATATGQTGTVDGSAEPQATTETEPPPPERPAVTRIAIVGGSVQGGAKTIEVGQGETVRIVVTADAPDEIHLHGYDIERNAAPGQPARFRFTADAEGEFEMESHVAEDAGKDPLVARLVVGPS
jgi:FtsP/CotA-like multicopper oxidase with cupredoxin domain